MPPPLQQCPNLDHDTRRGACERSYARGGECEITVVTAAAVLDAAIGGSHEKVRHFARRVDPSGRGGRTVITKSGASIVLPGWTAIDPLRAAEINDGNSDDRTRETMRKWRSSERSRPPQFTQ